MNSTGNLGNQGACRGLLRSSGCILALRTSGNSTLISGLRVFLCYYVSVQRFKTELSKSCMREHYLCLNEYATTLTSFSSHYAREISKRLKMSQQFFRYFKDLQRIKKRNVIIFSRFTHWVVGKLTLLASFLILWKQFSMLLIVYPPPMPALFIVIECQAGFI